MHNLDHFRSTFRLFLVAEGGFLVPYFIRWLSRRLMLAEADFQQQSIHHRNNSPSKFFNLHCLWGHCLSFMTNEWSKSRAYHDPDYESRIQAALTGYRERKYSSLAAAARHEDVSDMFYLNYWSSTIMFRSHTQHLLTTRKELTSQRRRLLPHDAPFL